MYRLPVYGHNAAKSMSELRTKKRRKQDRKRTDLRSLHNLIMLEWIEVILNIHRRAFLNGPSTEEWIGRLKEHAHML
jgi:hypothetical protein